MAPQADQLPTPVQMQPPATPMPTAPVTPFEFFMQPPPPLFSVPSDSAPVVPESSPAQEYIELQPVKTEICCNRDVSLSTLFPSIFKFQFSVPAYPAFGTTTPMLTLSVTFFADFSPEFDYFEQLKLSLFRRCSLIIHRTVS